MQQIRERSDHPNNNFDKCNTAATPGCYFNEHQQRELVGVVCRTNKKVLQTRITANLSHINKLEEDYKNRCEFIIGTTGNFGKVGFVLHRIQFPHKFEVKSDTKCA